MMRNPVIYICIFCFSGTGSLWAAEFSELQWLHGESDILRLLSTSPLECLDVANQSDQAYQAQLGYQLFRNPALLGDQAAELGLSCNSCHNSGRDNPDFYMEGLSGAPGTVDISSSLFSKVGQDNDSLDLLPIPSLVDSNLKNRFGTQFVRDSLTEYIDVMIVDEYQDIAIPAEAVTALTAYVQALSSTACPEQQQDLVAHSVGHSYYEIERSIAVLQEAASREDGPMLALLMGATQVHLQQLHRHYDIPATREQAGRISEMRRELEAIRGQLATLEADQLRDQLGNWFRNLRSMRPALLKASPDSLYLRDNLEQWLEENL